MKKLPVAIIGAIVVLGCVSVNAADNNLDAEALKIVKEHDRQNHLTSVLQNTLSNVSLKEQIAKKVMDCRKNGGCYEDNSIVPSDVRPSSSKADVGPSSLSETPPAPIVMPPMPEISAQAKIRMPRSAPRLVSILGDTAVFVDRGNKEEFKVGQKLSNGLMIHSIGADRVVLKKGKRKQVLTLNW